jgi:hypothetical protein
LKEVADSQRASRHNIDLRDVRLTLSIAEFDRMAPSRQLELRQRRRCSLARAVDEHLTPWRDREQDETFLAAGGCCFRSA